MHIGLAKTGTTAIQRCLSRNESELAGRGVYCPIAGRLHSEVVGHHLLPWSILYPARQDSSVWTRLRRELHLAGAAEDLALAVLSAEDFSALDAKQIARVKSYLQGFDVDVLLYLRNQRDYMISLYKQFLKTGHYRRDFQSFIEDFSDRCDYGALMSRWSSVFGDTNLNVRLYDRVEQTSGLMEDFFSVLLPKVEKSFLDGCRQRTGGSLSDASSKVVLLLNRVESRFPSRPAVIAATSFFRRKVRRRTRVGYMVEKIAGLLLPGPLCTDEDITSLRDAVSGGNEGLYGAYLDQDDRLLMQF